MESPAAVRWEPLARAYQSWLEDEADEVWAGCGPCPCPPDEQTGGAQSRDARRVG